MDDITDFGIVLGSESAPKTMIEYINLRCPYCKQFWNQNYSLLDGAIKSGQLKLVIKLLDKVKPSLQRGNIMHHHITLDEPELAVKEIQQIFDTQDDWSSLSLSEVASFAKEKLGLKEQMNDRYVTKIFREAESANIVFVPTAIIEDNIFDEHLDLIELDLLINQNK
nr:MULTISPECIES: thioredoxin domain-containing protein [unclassified Enterococcus]